MNSFEWNAAFAIGFALFCALGSPAAAQLGGNPSDAFSCYSDCGVRGGNATQRCACDDMCNVRGDCCADRNLYCSTSAAAPACSLTTNNKAAHGSDFCGTDLGFVVEHAGNLEVLFGDSWEWNSDPMWAGTCTTRGVNGLSDDSQGWMKVTPRPPSLPFRAASIPATGISDCNSTILNLDKHVVSDPFVGSRTTYKHITLRTPDPPGLVTDEELQLLPGSTPTAAFSDGTNMWAMFKANGPPEYDEPGHTYLAFREGARTNYRVGVDLGNNTNNIFLNPSATRITDYNDDNPKLSDFTLPTGANAGVLLIFTRPKFWSTSSEDADANGMYLVRQEARMTTATSGASGWAPQYFTGIDPMTDKPGWSPDKSAARPMLVADGTAAGDFKSVNEIDVKWVPQLRKWILLYGGDVHFSTPPPTNDQPRHGAIHMRMADYPWGPWSPPTPLLWRESMRGYFNCDAPLPPAPATRCPWPEPAGSWCGCDPRTYSVGTWQSGVSGAIPGCRKTNTQPIQPNTATDFTGTSCWFNTLIPNPNWNQRGLLYAPELIPSWTNAGTQNIFSNLLKTVTIYFAVSTWMPYQVVLAAADLNVPINDYNEGPRVVQLRDYQGRFLTVGPIGITEPKPPVSNTVNKTTAWWLQLVPTVPAQPADQPIRIGDLVYIRSLNDNGLTYLSRTGDYVRFDKPGTNLESRHQWKIDTTDPVRYPDKTPIEIGVTPILIKDTGTRRLKSKVTTTGQPNVVRNLTGGGSDGVWKMTWHCQNGDSCP